MSATPEAASGGAEGVIALSGPWTLAHGRPLEERIDALSAAEAGAGAAVIDLSRVTRLDTLGAHLINRLSGALEKQRVTVELRGATPEQVILLREVALRDAPAPQAARESAFVSFLTEIGEAVALAGKDVAQGTAFLGEFCVALARAARRPGHFRLTSLVKQLEQVAFRSVPIVVLITFLVGAIVAQQGVFQMQNFGATIYGVDLLGILVFRELALLLAAIMIAGRSGSAFTAEIGSMKMREEIDALRTMGLDPMAVLVLPRVLALVIGLPMLAFIAALSALVGGGLVLWIYGGVSPEIFFNRLQNAISMNTFLAGLIKAPFMGLVIGLIACIEGMSVKGSAESLGRQTTESVVKAIFMVIVVDGLFAMFFASIQF